MNRVLPCGLALPPTNQRPQAWPDPAGPASPPSGVSSLLLKVLFPAFGPCLRKPTHPFSENFAYCLGQNDDFPVRAPAHLELVPCPFLPRWQVSQRPERAGSTFGRMHVGETAGTQIKLTLPSSMEGEARPVAAPSGGLAQACSWPWH